MYNKKLKNLINAALADGELSEKEKQILFKNAQDLGVDLDEFEMVLDAKLLKKKKQMQQEQAVTQPQVSSAPKSNKLGDVWKCPQCGAVIGTFKMICPECGFEFSGVGANKFVEEFSRKLRKEARWESYEIDFVKNYPLPLTKEDCVEMLNYILPKTQVAGANRTTGVWRNKYNAILYKLERENSGNQKILDLVESYKKQAKVSGFGKLIIWWKGLSEETQGNLKFLIGAIAFVIAFVTIMIISYVCSV